MGNELPHDKLSKKPFGNSLQVSKEMLDHDLAVIPSSISENANSNEFSSIFAENHGRFLMSFISHKQISNIFKPKEDILQSNKTNKTIKIPESRTPKLLSSLSLQKKTMSGYWGILKNSKMFSDDLSKRLKFIKQGDIMELIRDYSHIIQKPKKQYISSKLKLDLLYEIRYEPINKYYDILDQIGEGSFGNVYKAECLKTRSIKAIKILKKKFLKSQEEKALLSEINLLKKIDHINIIKLYDIFYDKNLYYIVTEYCEGGNLLDAILQKKIQSEAEMVIIMRQILRAVSYLHQNKIAHLDLKLQNVVLVRQLTSNNIHQCVKIIDFGLAREAPKFFNNPCNRVGTLSHMAPEIFKNKFSCHSDIWSCGVILCLMLTGYNPFRRRVKEQTISAILNSQIDTERQQWQRVSKKGKDLVKLMLVKKPQKRIPVMNALNHEWFQDQQDLSAELTDNQEFMNKILHYYRGNSFTALIRNYLISKKITQTERQEMAILFHKLDKDQSGFLQFKEVIQLYKAVKGTSLTSSTQLINQLSKKIKEIDENGSGKIDFQEFLLVMIKVQSIKNQEYLNEAFDFFDCDQTGYIEKQQLINWIQNEEEACNMILQIDWNGDGRVSREQFIQYMNSYCFQ